MLTLSSASVVCTGVPQLDEEGSVPSHSLSVGAALEDRALAVLSLRWNLKRPRRLRCRFGSTRPQKGDPKLARLW